MLTEPGGEIAFEGGESEVEPPQGSEFTHWTHYPFTEGKKVIPKQESKELHNFNYMAPGKSWTEMGKQNHGKERNE